ncbi:immunity 22 family protein [Deinococcus lacus]|uniref:Immunity 22 family protein n=1 Tax=Deinococcus lacus TaxID=392561 RepID=A0ABW1YD90_9DEIO
MPYQPVVVTVWLLTASDESSLYNVFEIKYDEDGEALPSTFQKAYGLGWYDTDFAELHSGQPAPALLTEAANYCRTLDEQTLSRLPEGDWNGLYLIFGAAGEEWTHPDARPPMPHKAVNLDGVTCKLLGSFHVVLRS